MVDDIAVVERIGRPSQGDCALIDAGLVRTAHGAGSLGQVLGDLLAARGITNEKSGAGRNPSSGPGRFSGPPARENKSATKISHSPRHERQWKEAAQRIEFGRKKAAKRSPGPGTPGGSKNHARTSWGIWSSSSCPTRQQKPIPPEFFFFRERTSARSAAPFSFGQESSHGNWDEESSVTCCREASVRPKSRNAFNRALNQFLAQRGNNYSFFPPGKYPEPQAEFQDRCAPLPPPLGDTYPCRP